jgi:hypothetical protein
MADTNLMAVLAAEEREPVDLPRLTTANLFTHYMRIGKALNQAIEAYKALPDAAPKACDSALLDIAKQCDIASKTAMRLLEANR